MSGFRDMGQASGTDNPTVIYGENICGTPVDEWGGRGGRSSLFRLKSGSAVRLLKLYSLTANRSKNGEPMKQQNDLVNLAKKINYDLTAIKTSMAELTRQLAELNLPDRMRVRCRHCGLSLPGERSLAEHLYTSHDGPEPTHWLEAERRSANP